MVRVRPPPLMVIGPTFASRFCGGTMDLGASGEYAKVHSSSSDPDAAPSESSPPRPPQRCRPFRRAEAEAEEEEDRRRLRRTSPCSAESDQKAVDGESCRSCSGTKARNVDGSFSPADVVYLPLRSPSEANDDDDDDDVKSVV